MKNFLFFLFLITFWKCVPYKRNEAINAYAQLKKTNMLPLLNFVIDTRGINDSGQLIVRSIRYFEVSGGSYLIYPKIDSIDIIRFCKKQNLTLPQTDTIINILLTHQAKTKATAINSNPKLGEFVYYSFENDDKVLVYCPDARKIYNSYWKNYINKGKKLDDYWYIIIRTEEQ